MFSKEWGANARATVRNRYQIQLKKRYLLPQKSWCSVKEDRQRPAQAKFSRTPSLRNIYERLLLKISTPAANLAKGGIS